MKQKRDRAPVAKIQLDLYTDQQFATVTATSVTKKNPDSSVALKCDDLAT